MGVPKFFRYTSERYPCLNELVKQYQIPDFDNMYLDMNGIIHNCSHPDDSNPHFRITEEKIFTDIFHYISMLFQIIKPKKLFFMAIDGVAPRAKMNQQRGRRFRSAREAQNLEDEARNKGEVLPTEKRFDSNCITPGTVFMAHLHEQLRFFVKQKMSNDPLWSKVKVILSGHETPGEGEHKIMDYIRWSRSQPDYDPNTRHCLYGLDADLIMLGMCTHEPHFALLREEVKFNKSTQRTTSPEETNFYLLHLSLLREYLEQEFLGIKDNLPFPYDIEKIVDDWVLMGFLVGNDFIPNLPNMHISNDALPLLYKTYMTVLPTLDGYINEAGDLNLARFEIFMQELAKIDMEKFQDTYADLKYFEMKTGRRPNAMERKEYKPNNDETFNVDIDNIKSNKPDDELQALIDATQDMFMEDVDNDEEYEETSDEESNIQMEFVLHKKDYYMNKLDYSKVTEEVLADQAEGYVRAIQWNLYYYYKGCPSWCWYYPHHYAPYISDIKGFKDLKIEFELGEPFKPFEQLLAVLPAASKHLLPAPFHDLMTDEDSPIVHYYPVNFETDLNGKRNDWEAVVLIPFIDETNLLSAMTPCYQRLTEEELNRNTPGPMLIFNWTQDNQGETQAPSYFEPIRNCHAIETRVWRNELDVPEEKLKRGMLPNARRDMLFPGFPTMRHLKYRTSITKAKVRVFDQPSRNDNMMVELIRENEKEDSLQVVAEKYLGKVIWVGWPHLTRAKVISVSDETKRFHHAENADNGLNYICEKNAGNLHKQWISERSTILEHNKYRLGIELGDVNIIIHAVNLKGYKYLIQDKCQMVHEPEWCTISCGYAVQAVVSDVTAYIMQDACKYSTVQEAYPTDDQVFLLTQGQYYGCLATVVDSESIRNGRIKVQVIEKPEPTPTAYNTANINPYKSANHAAASCGISTYMLSRITGTLLVIEGKRNDLPTENLKKINIGLSLKFNKKNQEVSGYSRKCSVSNTWLYSERCVALVSSFAQNFPDLFDTLMRKNKQDIYFESDLWPDDAGESKLKEVVQWLKEQPHSKAPRRECGSEALESDDMRALADALTKELNKMEGIQKKVTLQVKWNLLYKPELHEGNIQPDPNADFKLYDRVVSVARNITVPFGARGTITAVYAASVGNTVRLSDKLNARASYQVMFDEPFQGAMPEDLFEEPRFYRMCPTKLLNISFGRKLRQPETVNDCFNFSKTPTLLRREDGHNSAFANYSPPVDKLIALSSENKEPEDLISKPSQDNATNLLRSLLKISETETEPTNKDKSKTDNVNNWRVKMDPSVLTPKPQPPPVKNQHEDWRKEANNFNSSVKPQQTHQVHTNEWVNTNFKNHQTPVPPFPTFGQPFPGPGPSQVPFPQFQNPHFQIRNKNQQMPPYPANQRGQFNQPNQPSNHFNQPSNQFNQKNPSQSSQGFPKHLPSVSSMNARDSLIPSWIRKYSPASNSEQQVKSNPQQQQTANPFVPLQVQTSQRRNQTSSNISAKKDSDELLAPKSILPKPQPTSVAVSQVQQPNLTKKPVKKKKLRLAANLPFQID